MTNSSAPAAVLLPFGSLTGVMPIDSIPRGRVLGDFSSVLGCDRLIAHTHRIPFSLDPIPVVPRSRRPFDQGDGGIWTLSPEAEGTGG